MTTEELLRKRITDQLQPRHLEIKDDSHAHAGHTGRKHHGGGHYTAVVVSEQFTDKTLVQRHRMVYEAVGDMLKQEVHALSMQTHTPEEWTGRTAEQG